MMRMARVMRSDKIGDFCIFWYSMFQIILCSKSNGQRDMSFCSYDRVGQHLMNVVSCVLT